MIHRLAPALASASLVLYPLCIYLGVTRGPYALWISLAVLSLLPALALRWHRHRAQRPQPPALDDATPREFETPSTPEAPKGAPLASLWWIPALTLGALSLSALFARYELALVTPVAINLALLSVFASSLRRGAPMIERFARLIDPELSPEQQAWCRLWTIIWCGYFLINASISGALALFAPLFWWSLYTSLLAYIGMGLLFASERYGRWRKFRR